MSKLLALRGISGSGKSTYARELKAQGWVVVSRDDIRETMFRDYQSVREDVVTVIQDAAIEAALGAGLNVVIDDTNIRVKYLKRFAAIALKHFATFDIKEVECNLNVAIGRVMQRALDGGRDVPGAVIRRQAQGLKSSRVNLAELYVDVQAGELYEPPGTGRKAIIVDIDGTLAYNNGHRGFYDYEKVGDDEVKQVIADLVSRYDMVGYYIIIMSGRDDVCEKATTDWLDRYCIPWDHIFMRKTGDMRRDSIVKMELFDTHVRHEYDVEFVLDDRQQVVDMWRSIGLTCLQVAPGNF